MRRLEIKNFKSIENISIDCKRINIFVGWPNTGKSNILEAIGLLSHLYYGRGLKDFVRMDNMTDLFYNKQTSKEIAIMADDKILRIQRRQSRFFGLYQYGDNINTVFDYDYRADGSRNIIGGFKDYKFYRFKELRRNYTNRFEDFLLPPDGENLASLLIISDELQDVFREILSGFDYKLVIKEYEAKIEVQREVKEGFLIAFPLHTVSETLYRLLLHLAVIITNRNSVIAFEEPEVHTYPYYTKYLAERIANDKRNQYFITTHNPYMLIPLVEKTSIGDLSINITYMKDHKTKIHSLREEEIELLLDLEYDSLVNLDKFLEKI